MSWIQLKRSLWRDKLIKTCLTPPWPATILIYYFHTNASTILQRIRYPGILWLRKWSDPLCSSHLSDVVHVSPLDGPLLLDRQQQCWSGLVQFNFDSAKRNHIKCVAAWRRQENNAGTLFLLQWFQLEEKPVMETFIRNQLEKCGESC